MQRFDLKRFRLDRKLTQKELAEILMCTKLYFKYRKRNKTYFKREIGYITKTKYGIKRSHSRRFHVCWC